MLNSLHYGLALIAILLILRWYIISDGDGQNDGWRGLLAMKRNQAKPPPPAPQPGKRSFRRKA
jgi:hypothetical protein